mgnify:CR=1 FL=1
MQTLESFAPRGLCSPATPQPPPPPPTPAARAVGRQASAPALTVASTADLMKRHLRRKANVKLVDGRDEVARLLRRLADSDELAALLSAAAAAHAPLGGGADARGSNDDGGAARAAEGARAQLVAVEDYFAHASAQLDGYGLSVEGTERWETRLAIARRGADGGGLHFSPDELADAARAHARLDCISDFVAASRQLAAKGAEVRAVASALAYAGTDAEAKLGRLADVMSRVGGALGDLFGDGPSYVRSRERWLAAGLPAAHLDAAARTLARDVLVIPWYAAGLALDEVTRADKEPARSRPFRLARALKLVRRARELCAETRQEAHARPGAAAAGSAAFEGADGGAAEQAAWPAELTAKEAELADAEKRLEHIVGAGLAAEHDELDEAV